MRKHIIVEGMDGSGKDTLIARLLELFPSHRPHTRASTSLGGPVDDLAMWTAMDVRTMGEQVPSIYNRHPLVSEPIYAPLRTVNVGLRSPWNNPLWITRYRRETSKHAVLVVCQPPYSTASDNLDKSKHMPGVSENRVTLYLNYSGVMWPGPTIRYDYTVSTPEVLADLIRKSHDWQEN